MKKSPKKPTIDLSVIILNYNSGNYLSECLQSLKRSDLKSYKVEFIIIDNASSDNSIALAKSVPIPNTKYQIPNTNLGFAAGNNYGLKYISNPRYVLFLNPDTRVEPNTLAGMIKYFDDHQYVDAATCNVILAKTGLTQPESHRDFPTPLNALLHFSGINSGQYFMEHLDYSKLQPINACVGAFLMVKLKVGGAIGWWNEKYFMYGEDLDFCYKLKLNNFKLFFIPDFKITHFQGISSGIKKTKSTASRQTKTRSALATTNAMRIFYQENLIQNYSPFLKPLIMLGINLLEFIRVFKAKYL
jgi:hypothetical protein